MTESAFAVIGDVHGHLQLALCVAARWQQELHVKFEAVFICGDIGSFTEDSQLDNATRRHARTNPCELEFLLVWAARPQPEWLGRIFQPLEDEGLGLECPVIVVHGNHEGFAHLAELAPKEIPDAPVEFVRLPAIDTGSHIRFLPPGWRVRLPSGLTVAGLGGIERGQRNADYHEMAYIDDDAILHLTTVDAPDLLITHQGPAQVQGEKGSQTLDILLDSGKIPLWFHGHSINVEDPVFSGPVDKTLIVPLHDIAFPGRGPKADDPGEGGWAWGRWDGTRVEMKKENPDFLRDFRRKKWLPIEGEILVAPPLVKWAR